MKRKILLLLLALLVVISMAGCSENDPITETIYIEGDLYVWDGDSWELVNTGLGGVGGAHAASHTDGTDDVQDATAAQKGLMTLAYAGKLDGIEALAKDDLTGAQIKALYEVLAKAFTDGQFDKLAGIELLADVTDAGNVDGAGATMNVDWNAQGDLLSASGDDTPLILTVGADTFVLTADSGEATGLIWAAPAGGAGLSYTEMDGSDQTTAAGQGGGDGAWVAWDLSAIIGAGSEVVEIRIQKYVASDSCGVRANGSGLAREFGLLKNQTLILLCECDGNRIIQIQSDDVSDNDTFSVLGYWN